MKKNLVRIAALPTSALFVLTLAGCLVESTDAVYAAPVRATVVVESNVFIPDYYVWDGYEYVGLVDGRYYYLGQGSLWFACEPWREHRFQDWERHNPRWRDHAERNERFRKGPDGRLHPIGSHEHKRPNTPPPPPRNVRPGEHDLHPQHPGKVEPKRPPHQGNVAPVVRHQPNPTTLPPPHPTYVPPPPPSYIPPLPQNVSHPANIPPPPRNTPRHGSITPPNAQHPQHPGTAQNPHMPERPSNAHANKNVPPTKNNAKPAPGKAPATRDGKNAPTSDNASDKQHNGDANASQKR